MAILEVVPNQGHVVPYSIEYFNDGVPFVVPNDFIPKGIIAINRGEPTLLNMEPSVVNGKVVGTIDTGKLDAGKFWFDMVVTDEAGDDAFWTEPVRINNTKPVTPLI